MMSNVAEIVEAVKQLTPQEKLELVVQLESVLLQPIGDHDRGGTNGYLSPEFTERLAAHFHQAKRAALGQT